MRSLPVLTFVLKLRLINLLGLARHVAMARPIKALVVTPPQREVLARLREDDSPLGLRARIILGLGEGLGEAHVAKDLNITIQTVSKWSRRFAERGIEGLADGPRSGRPRLGSEVVQKVCSARLGEIKWVAHEAGVSRSTASRWRREHPELVPEPEKRHYPKPGVGPGTSVDQWFSYYIHKRHTVWHVRREKPKIDDDAEG